MFQIIKKWFQTKAESKRESYCPPPSALAILDSESAINEDAVIRYLNQRGAEIDRDTGRLPSGIHWSEFPGSIAYARHIRCRTTDWNEKEELISEHSAGDIRAFKLGTRFLKIEVGMEIRQFLLNYRDFIDDPVLFKTAISDYLPELEYHLPGDVGALLCDSFFLEYEGALFLPAKANLLSACDMLILYGFCKFEFNSLLNEDTNE